MLTLTPGVDFDLDFVNARIRDGTKLKETVETSNSPNKTQTNGGKHEFTEQQLE